MIAESSGDQTVKVLQPSLFERAEMALANRNISKAITLYNLAENGSEDPDSCAAGRWLCHALLGDFETAWQESDEIERRGKPDANRFWDGKPLDNRRILVRCLHGLGDTIQFVRYLPLLRQRGVTVTLEAQPPLKNLLERSGLADRVITWGEPEGSWDGQIEIMELPRIFRTTLETIPTPIPYLKTGAQPAGRQPGELLRVGLVWASSSFNPTRSVPLPLMSRLCQTRGVEFFSFQAGEDRKDLAACPEYIRDLYNESGCVLAAAERLVRMHLLITADTMMAHLAGALGRPVWTVLPTQADWRWMLDRSDSPWYPSMRLFRQAEPGDWESVMAEVQVSLSTLASGPATAGATS